MVATPTQPRRVFTQPNLGSCVQHVGPMTRGSDYGVSLPTNMFNQNDNEPYTNDLYYKHTMRCESHFQT